jgi:hypothetical protein
MGRDMTTPYERLARMRDPLRRIGAYSPRIANISLRQTRQLSSARNSQNRDLANVSQPDKRGLIDFPTKSHFVREFAVAAFIDTPKSHLKTIMGGPPSANQSKPQGGYLAVSEPLFVYFLVLKISLLTLRARLIPHQKSPRE